MPKLNQIRLGNPLGNHGGIYHITDMKGLMEAAVDLRASQLTAQGKLIMEDGVNKIRQQINQQVRKYHRMIERLGIPESIRSLITAKSKRDVERVSANLSITEHELFLMIHNSTQLGFSHRSKFRDFVPAHLQITDRDRQVMNAGFPDKSARKMFSLLKSRKMVQVHLFEMKAIWHCFFFTYGDIEDSDENHWKKGAHLHYISYLWPRLDATHVWDGFDNRRGRVSGGVHVKFVPYDFPNKPGIGSGSIVNQMFPIEGKPTKAKLAAPPAILQTRGTWTANVRVK